MVMKGIGAWYFKDGFSSSMSPLLDTVMSQNLRLDLLDYLTIGKTIILIIVLTT